MIDTMNAKFLRQNALAAARKKNWNKKEDLNEHIVFFLFPGFVGNCNKCNYGQHKSCGSGKDGKTSNRGKMKSKHLATTYTSSNCLFSHSVSGDKSSYDPIRSITDVI